MVKEGPNSNAPVALALAVRVSGGLNCEMAGAQHRLDRLPALFGGTLGVLPVLCIGLSEQAPAAVVQQHSVARATSLKLTPFHGHLMVLKPKESEMIKYRTAYAPEFRQQLVELVHAGRSANDVAKEFGLHATTVAKWVRLSPMGTPAAAPLPIDPAL